MTDVLIECLRLASVLNSLESGELNAAQAEQLLRISDEGEANRPHHVFDPEGVLGLDADIASPVRIALSRIANQLPDARWALFEPRPGRMAGLRGPDHANQLAMETGVIVVNHAGGIGWLPRPVGPAMQWELVRAEKPLLPPSPSEAAQMLNEQILESARALSNLDMQAGTRPDDAASIILGRSYPASNQRLLDQAMLWREACTAGMETSPELLHSHAIAERDEHLRRLKEICREAVSAAASWPKMPAETTGFGTQ